MKWVVRIVLVLVVLLVIAVVVGNIVLEKHLTTVINSQVLPAVEQSIGAPISVGDASVQLARGSVLVNQVNVGNPEGFDDPSLFAIKSADLVVAWQPLITAGIIQVERVAVQNAELRIIRNPEGKVNLQVLSERLQPKHKAEAPAEPKETVPEPAPPQPAARKPVTLPKARLQSLAVDTRVVYRDLAVNPQQPVEIELQNALSVEGLSTFADGTSEWAKVSLTGNLASDENLCVTDLQGRIAPVSDPLRMSFEIAGEIGKVNLDVIRSYLAQAGIEPENLALDLNLVCNDGVFDRDASVISFHMDNVQFSGRIKDELPKEVNYFSRLSVPIHLKGTLASPQADSLMQATLAALLTNIKDNVGAVAAGVAGSLLAEELEKRGGLDQVLGEETAKQLTESLKDTPLAKSPLLKNLLGEGAPAAETPESDAADEPAAEQPAPEPAKPEDQLKDALKGLFGGAAKDGDQAAETAPQEAPAEQVKDLFKKLF